MLKHVKIAIFVAILATLLLVVVADTIKPVERKIELAVTASIGGTFSPSLIAYAHDIDAWSKYRADVTILPFGEGEGAMISAVDRRGIQMGEGNPAVLASAIQRGIKIRMIATYQERSFYSVMIRSELPIKKIEDFGRTTLGVTEPGTGAYRSTRILAGISKWTEGRHYKLVTFQTFSEALIAFEQKKVEALLAPYTSLIRLETTGKGRFIAHLSDLLPSEHVESVFWASDQIIRTNPDLLRDVIRGIKNAHTSFRSEHGKALEWTQKYYRVDDATARRIWDYSKQIFYKDLQLNIKGLQNAKDIFEKSGLALNLPPVGFWYDNSILSNLRE